MIRNKSIAILSLVLLSAFVISCKSPNKSDTKPIQTKQEKAEDAIRTWIQKSNEYPHYKPIVFGELTPRYQRSDRTLNLSIQISEEEEAIKKSGNRQRLDSLKLELEKHKADMLGYLLPHKFQEKNMAGEKITRELLFFLDTSLRVASALTPESFDHILDEKVFFKLDSAHN
jgi:hypothetical protein